MLAATASCGLRSPDEPPGPGWERGSAPSLTGATVLVLPVQRSDVPDADIDGEISFALRARAGERVQLRDASNIDGMTQGAGALAVDPAHLDVGAFYRGEVGRVGDPLYGDQYRLAAFVGADFVLLPIEARAVAHEGAHEGASRGASEEAREGADEGAHGEQGVSVVLNAVLLEPRSGRVLWQGILEGDQAPGGSPGSAASVSERLAARLLP